MQVLPGVLFEMRPCDSNPLCGIPRLDVDPSVFADRRLILRDLIPLRKIWIEIILSSKPVRLDGTVQCQTRADRHLNHGPIDDRQAARHAEAYGTGLRIGRKTESGSTAAKHFR